MIELATTNLSRWRYDPFAASYNVVGFRQRDIRMPEGSVIGRRILDHLERRGWSLGMLAAKSGLNKGYLSQLTRGHVKNPGTETLGKISDALRVPLSEVTGERAMPRRQIQVTGGGAGVPVWRRRVHAGEDFPWMETDDTMWVSGDLIASRPNLSAAIVTGSCMDPHVMPGEKVVFDPDAKPVDGDMVVVTTDDGETMVKWYTLDDDGRPCLKAMNREPIYPNGAKIEGTVVSLARQPIRYPRA
jgi:transcriptional regulator with XRE-family HTH domain